MAAVLLYEHVVQKVVQSSLSENQVGLFEFSAVQRLRRKDGFDHVFRKLDIADKYFKIFFTRNTRENARLGIMASKRTLPRAVDRNKVKRMIREAFRIHSIKECELDLVVLVKTPYAQPADFKVEKLNRLFGQIEVRCAES